MVKYFILEQSITKDHYGMKRLCIYESKVYREYSFIQVISFDRIKKEQIWQKTIHLPPEQLEILRKAIGGD